MVGRRAAGNGAIEALSRFMRHVEEVYGPEIFSGMAQSDFTEELLIYLWTKGYKVVPLEQEDYNAN
jgi:hypothetical protein